MTAHSLLRSLKGPFSFLQKDAAELLRLVPDAERSLPTPQKIYLEDEGATPLAGFPILETDQTQALEQALEQYLLVEEQVRLAVVTRQTFDPGQYAAAWERYRGHLARATENATASSYGRHLPAIFWLNHSMAVARILRETPKRILRHSLALGRDHGDEIRYQVLFKYLDRVADLTYDVVHRLATETEEVEEELFPALFTRMRDNVLIFTEEHISPNLAELGPYFAGYLHIDSRDFRSRLAALSEWHAAELRRDAELRRSIRLLGADPDGEPRDLLYRTGYVTFLASCPGYDTRTLLPHTGVQVWESLLVKLKEFELLHAFRRLMIPVERRGDDLTSRDRSLRRFGVSPQLLRLSPSTRPLDFGAPWVVDPVVSRFGLIYDISDFSETISILRRSGGPEQDRSFRQLFLFQRRVNRLAAQHRTKMEKYLGDGAFYSSREAKQLLALAVQVQRHYRQALSEGFPFSRGLRIALNFGQYRLLPIQAGIPGEAERYEFFGHGVVELTRLTSGKTTKEIDEIKILLINRGYPESTVNRFFDPLTAHNVDIVEKAEQARSFFAYINQNGTLVNEGIVATGAFISMLVKEGAAKRLFRAQDGDRGYIAVPIGSGAGSMLVGLRKLGLANLKGLDRLPVYEAVDGGQWLDATLVEIRGGDLLDALERDFLQRRSPAAAGPTRLFPPPTL